MKTESKLGKILLIIVSIFLIIYGIVYWQSKSSTTKIPAQTSDATQVSTTTTEAVSPIEIKKYSFNLYPKNSTSTDISIEYPSLKSGFASPDITTKINNTIATNAKELLNKTVTEYKSIQKEEAGLGSAAADNLYYQVAFNPTSVYISENTFSYSVALSTYSGGAHGAFSYEGFSYDTKTGKLISLDDVLKGNYQPVVEKYIQKQIATAIDLIDSVEGCENCENLSLNDVGFGWNDKIELKDFTLTKEGIVFLFGNYALGPYVETAGGQLILVPKTVLSDLVKRDW
ncbi:MAG: DUF3298 domain-containing protein [bacterium]